MIISAMTGVEYDDTCISEDLFCVDHERARRCAITLHCGTSSICFKKVVHEGVLVVKFMG